MALTAEQLESALRKADAAGDTAGARVLAGELRKLREAPAVQETPEEPSRFKAAMDTVQGLGDVATKFSPIHQLASKASEASGNIADWIEKGAYGAGGAVTDISMEAGATPEVASILGYGTNVATQAIPSILSGYATKAASSQLLKGAGRKLMQSALKPSSAFSTKEVAEGVETMLKEGLNVTPGGVRKLLGRVTELSSQVDDMIAAAQKSGAKVSKLEALKRVKDTLRNFKMQVDPKSDTEAIRRVARNFLNNPAIKNADEIPVQLAQDLKKGTYRALGTKPYGEMSGAQSEAQKALARGLKEEIERVVPGVAAPNQRQQALLNALEMAESRAKMAGNTNIGGLAYLAHDPVAAAGFMLDRSSLSKSILGRLLYTPGSSILGLGAGLGVAGGMASTANR